MTIELKLATPSDTKLIYTMQKETFMPLLKKYKDYETSPANEPIEKTYIRINQPYTDYYLIEKEKVIVGAVRVVKEYKATCVISPIFVLPDYQGQNIAQEVIALLEQKYSDTKLWSLDTILQEKGNCHLYEKMGYRRTDLAIEVNKDMTLIGYEKRL